MCTNQLTRRLFSAQKMCSKIPHLKKLHITSYLTVQEMKTKTTNTISINVEEFRLLINVK